jgi:tetratricopeptide (TPR) repeat protein
MIKLLALSGLLVLVAMLVFGPTGLHARNALISAGSAPAPTPRPTRPATLTTAADYLMLGDYDFDRNDYHQAIEDYGHAIDLKPDFAEAYNNRAYTYMTIQEYALALPDLNEAIRLRPNYVNALMNRGDIYNYYYQIDYERALQDYNRVLAIDPNAPNLCGHRMLATSHGWNPGVLGRILLGGVDAGCG